MATGDQADLLARLNSVLPPWFGAEETPILTGALAAFAYVGTVIYNQEIYDQLQMRISTATDTNLDEIAVDFFGVNKFLRGANEGDVSYRNRILASLIRERATRRGMINILTLLTGTAPIIYEPGRAADCAYNYAGGYNEYGGYFNADASAALAYQCFITVFSPTVSSIANVPGWNSNPSAWGGHGSSSSWSNPDNFTNSLNAAQIYQAINDTKPEGTVCWVQIKNA